MTESGASPSKRYDLLIAPFFVLSVFILVFNDLYLKSAYPNWITGKLSDFAGLFAFTLFWFAFFPRKRLAIVLVTLALFAWWKTPCSTPIIDAWNRVGILTLARVLDYTDWVALLVLPLAYGYLRVPAARQPSRAYVVVAVLVSSFAFMATSSMSPEYAAFHDKTFSRYVYEDVNVEYPLTTSKAEAINRLKESFGVNVGYDFPRFREVFTIMASRRCCYEAYRNSMPADCDHFDYADVNFPDNAGNTTLRLFNLNVCDKPNPLGKDGALKIFERAVIERLGPANQ